MGRKKKPYARERPVTMAFRMSEEATRRLDAPVSLSGLIKQDYIECCLSNQSVTVYPSSHIAQTLSYWMQSIYRELVVAREEGRMLDADLLWIARAVSKEYGVIAAADQRVDARIRRAALRKEETDDPNR